MSEALAKALLQGVGVAHSCENPRLIETHISWLILLGDYAYKLKKPVNLGFLDFSSLAKRRHFCAEEIRLNRRTAPGIYIDALPVSGTDTAPRLGDASAPIDYVVRMHRFEEDALMSDIAARSELTADMIQALAHAIASFHGSAARADRNAPHATPQLVKAPADDNVRTLRQLVATPDARHQIESLTAWAEAQFDTHRRILQQRHDSGYIRECHGD
ncbi:MAG TPA: hypothetical protein VJ998_04415, partial [Pseudomonadales bacterium]|nr:hypothetical protein [Pseudomonadales bacterium]